MTKRTRNHIDDLRGAIRLAVAATKGVTALVEAMQVTIGSGPDLLGRPLSSPAALVTRLVHGSLRGVTELVGASIDLALGNLAPMVGERGLGPDGEAILSALNGVLGDYLCETANPLAVEMQLRRGGVPLELDRKALRAALPQVGGKLLVLVHGSCMSDRQWKRSGHDHGAALARDLGYTPVYLHYNTGLHISTNGHAFASLLERLVAEWPAPLDELTILAHSMGGLVSRSACHSGEVAGHLWRKKLRRLVCLGTPHRGSPFERAGSRVDLLLGVSRYSAPFARLGKIRSAGITDMRFGSVLDEDWQGRDRFSSQGACRHLGLPAGVECYAIAGALGDQTRARLGDGVIPVRSALGWHDERELALDFPEAHQWIAADTGHLDLLCDAEVYATLRRWLS